MSIYEAWLFSFLGQVVDLLSTWQAGGDVNGQESRVLWGIGIVLLTSVGLVALRTMVQHQVLAINLPLRLRWDFHRLMLRQSLSFFSDEFSGRVTTKVMQTALAVREGVQLLRVHDVRETVQAVRVAEAIQAGSRGVSGSSPLIR